MEQRLEIAAAVAFYGGIIVFALLERVWPRRRDAHSFLVRWTSNISLLLIELGLSRIVVPGGLVALAYLAQGNDWGLLNTLALPAPLTVLASVAFLDLLKYWEHRLIHGLPLLWRLHVVHHADLDVDFTTTFRHHPLEVVFSWVVSGAAILVLGLSPLGVLFFIVFTSLVATLSHANVRWNTTADRMLRSVFMTRDAHAVHHSALKAETDSNFGLVFIWWDRLFRTYRDAPAGGLDDYEIGVEYFRTSRALALDRVLTMPFQLPASRPERARFGSVDHSNRPV